ncbi:putative XPA-binding protein 1 [Gregarina niphandrodes]|uniref:GPN-loop GTPase n=1 Tax=Gregarina niphandrodes TaxID=110365 RepID=A0A023B3W0_GRENI|nr:putative XPA-binding protein 1 [Gregarina niphandrodes]EZG56048.1 putative XPA-binding protein 1 [Gregarina niphandrodes]|eukprot:XP_011131367.1 putative XPA-binding protein 1 [Gregarina niphandrodes]
MSDSLPLENEHRPVAIVVIGMAGAGKSTFVSALYTYLATVAKKRVYCINIDPAVDNVNFPCNIDIRDTVNYREVMKEYGLGPNGAILTSLNLFATRFDGVLNLLERRMLELDYVLIDTPGQIEVFNWSASGTIILDTLALVVPATLVYLVDSVRCQRPTTLMSSLLYASSLTLKSKLPCLNVFTKTDLASSKPLEDMIQDYAAFCDAAEQEDTYAASMAKSCCLALSPFYTTIPRTAVAINGETRTLTGFERCTELIQDLKKEYFSDYLPWIKKKREDVEKKKVQDAKEQLSKFDAECDDDSDAE